MVINVIDASNLERNLCLTTQLVDMNVRMVCALNMYDEFERRGDTVDLKTLSTLFGMPMIPTSFKSGMGVKELFRHMIKMNQMFITEQTFIRVTDERKPIFPDDLSGVIDIEVNVGVVAGNKQQQAQSMQLLLSMYPQLIQAGIADISHAANAFGRLVEALGYKVVKDGGWYIRNPKTNRFIEKE